MNTARNLIKVCVFALSLLVFPGAKAEVLQRSELVCTGLVTYDQNTFSDQIVLQLTSSDVLISGEAGMTSTFDGGHHYTICSESKNELDFAYTKENKCDDKATRIGHLHKVIGRLRLTRSDLGTPFVGVYKCRPAQRILN